MSIEKPTLNLLLLATPVYAQLAFLGQCPGAPDPERSRVNWNQRFVLPDQVG
jgi:hypothetical protein